MSRFSLHESSALKFLSEIFSGDPERLTRFEREAKLLASMNHPHIATIHGLGQQEGKRLLVMELVEGETLAQQLERGILPDPQNSLLWLDPAGNTTPAIPGTKPYSMVRLSSNGQQIAFGTVGMKMQLWIYDRSRRTENLLTMEGKAWEFP